MKKTLLTFCFAALSGALVYAQGIEIALHTTTTDISGTVHSETATTSNAVEVSFDVFNTGATTENYIITRIILNQPTGWSNYFCWGHSTDPLGGTCYPPNAGTTYVSGDPITIAPTEHGVLKCYVTPPSASAAPGVYRYYVGTSTTPKMDSIDFSVNSVLAVKEIKKDINLSVSPNPATDNVSIQVSNFESGTLKIVDVLGNVVLNSNFNGSKILNVSDFKNGVYFIMISGDGMTAINRKLVVRH